METPVIGVRIQGIEDLLEDECGLLVDKGDRWPGLGHGPGAR